MTTDQSEVSHLPPVTEEGSHNEPEEPQKTRPEVPPIQTQDVDLDNQSIRRTFRSLSIKRLNRSNTAFTYRKPHRGWQAGQEPGVDVSKTHSHMPGGSMMGSQDLDTDCSVTIVDYSNERMQRSVHDSTSFLEAFKTEKEPWVKVRWINVSGLSWPVIQQIGKKLRFHRLSVEDLMTKTRTKVDWYSENTFVLLTLQKLVQTTADDSVTISSDGSINTKKPKWGWLKRWLRPGSAKSDEQGLNDDYPFYDPETQTHYSGGPSKRGFKSLQSYYGGNNLERIQYMERHSMLAAKGFLISVEQVSIFLTNDNTVVSFFEHSAEDIEEPLMERLSSAETLLRKSNDASMLLQAILDAIIDLSYQIVLATQDASAELELDVLTDPSIKHTTLLYILTSELAALRTTLQPIATLVRALRDHRSDPTPNTFPSATGGVSLSNMTHVYLADVEDHCLSLIDGVDQMRRSADNLIDLIFNTVGAYQNESMKQLTLVTILFLPLTFLTGYFGMNFKDFGAIENSDRYFWSIAAPVAAGTLVIIMWGVLSRFFGKVLLRKRIASSRKERSKSKGD